MKTADGSGTHGLRERGRVGLNGRRPHQFRGSGCRAATTPPRAAAERLPRALGLREAFATLDAALLVAARRYVFSVVVSRAKERGLQSAGVLLSEGGFEILRPRLCLLAFLRDKSRAPAAILAGEEGRSCTCFTLDH